MSFMDIWNILIDEPMLDGDSKTVKIYKERQIKL